MIMAQGAPFLFQIAAREFLAGLKGPLELD
jgi:hypothetical protein